MSILLMQQRKKSKYILNKFQKSQLASAYSVARRLRTGILYAIRVRDDTNTETNIGFTGEKLDTASMLTWGQRNLLAGVPLGVDGNANGASDGWSHFQSGTGTVYTYDINDNAQRIVVTSSDANLGKPTFYSNITCVPGNALTFKVKIKTIGNVNAFIDGTWYNGASSISMSATSALTSYDNYTEVSITSTAPANTTKIELHLRIQSKTAGDTGSAWFKDASLTISNQSQYVVTAYDQTGNGNHVTQATAANQPRIVNQGIVDRDFDTTKVSTLWPTFASASGVTLVSNGNFVNTTGWVAGNSTLSASNNTLSVTGNGTLSSISTYQTTILTTIGKRLWVRAKLRVTDAVALTLAMNFQPDGTGTSSSVGVITSPVQNQWYTISEILTVPGTWTGNIRVKAITGYADAATANGKVMEVQEAVSIDVTDYGQPCMVFDGTNDCLIAPNSASLDITSQPLYLGAVFNVDSAASADGYAMCKNADASSNNQYALAARNNNPASTFYIEGSADNFASGASNSIVKGNQTLQSATWQNNTTQVYDKGVASGTTDTYSGTLTGGASKQLYLGARGNAGSTQSIFFKGKLTESVIATTTNASKLEANQKKFYSIA